MDDKQKRAGLKQAITTAIDKTKAQKKAPSRKAQKAKGKMPLTPPAKKPAQPSGPQMAPPPTTPTPAPSPAAEPNPDAVDAQAQMLMAVGGRQGYGRLN